MIQDKQEILDKVNSSIAARIQEYASGTNGTLFELFEDVIYQSDDEAFRALMIAGADVNLQHHKYGWTLLHMAIRRNQKTMVEFLIDHGADINRVDGVGWTPLMESIMDDMPELCELLITRGADKTIQNKRGATAAMLVQKFSRTNMMKHF